jgi:hypothetical protein
MNLKHEVRAAWVAQEIKRLWPRAAQPPRATPARAFKAERPPKEQSSRAKTGQKPRAEPPGRISPPES